ncbi:MAG TPA: RNA polymerase sigma factor [Planctomycetota bacterium]
MAAAATASITAAPLVAALVAPKDGHATEAPVASDEVLFEQAKRGDRESLGLLVSRYERALFGLLVRMTGGDRHRADDLFQDTFLHAMRAAETFNRKMQFKPWVMAIAVNLVRDDARKRKVRGEVTLDGTDDSDERTRAIEPAAAEEGPGQAAERRDEADVLRQALDRLTEIEREVVLLHFYNDLTLVETAAVLSVPVGTVKSRLHAALNRLSGMLATRAQREP